MQAQVPPQQMQQAPQQQVQQQMPQGVPQQQGQPQVPQQQMPQQPPVDPDADLKELAAIMHGEGASTKANVKIMIGSSVLNRLDAEKYEEFGASMEEVGQKGYYAAKDGTELYQNAKEGNFPDDMSEKSYKETYAIASGLIKGTIDRHAAMFFFKQKEENRIRKAGAKGKKEFNFDLVKEQGQVGDYRTYSY